MKRRPRKVPGTWWCGSKKTPVWSSSGSVPKAAVGDRVEVTDYEGWYPGVVEAVDVDDEGNVLYDVVYDNPEFEPEPGLKAALVRRVSQAAPERPPWAEALAQLENELGEAKKEAVKVALVDASMEDAVAGIKSFAEDNMDVEQVEDLADHLMNVAARKRKAATSLVHD